MRVESGCLVVRAWTDVPLRVHWSVPLAAFICAGGRFAPAAWLGFAAVIVVHLFGHALMVRRVGGTIHAVHATGWGGHCQWSGDPFGLEGAMVAAGGVLAQGLALVALAVACLLLGAPQQPALLHVVEAFVGIDLILGLINLIPIAPLDGAGAWPLLPYGFALLRERRERISAGDPGATLPDVARLVRLQAPLERDLERILREAARPPGGDSPKQPPASSRPRRDKR